MAIPRLPEANQLIQLISELSRSRKFEQERGDERDERVITNALAKWAGVPDLRSSIEKLRRRNARMDALLNAPEREPEADEMWW